MRENEGGAESAGSAEKRKRKELMGCVKGYEKRKNEKARERCAKQAEKEDMKN